MEKVLGITHFNFEDKEAKRINKGVNVHIANPVREDMGVGYQSQKVSFKIPEFNKFFGTKLPEEDLKLLNQQELDSLKSFINKEVTILNDVKGKVALVQFK